jgi:hypothetical protein
MRWRGCKAHVVDDECTGGPRLQSAAALADREAPPSRSDGLSATTAPLRALSALNHGVGERRPEKSVSAPRGMGMGKGGRHLTDRYRNPRPWSTGNHTVRDL